MTQFQIFGSNPPPSVSDGREWFRIFDNSAERTYMHAAQSICSRLPQITHQPWAHLGPTESSIARRRFKGDSGAIQGRFGVFWGDSAFQPIVPRGRRDHCKAIRVSPLTPFIILKWGKGCFHSHNSSWLAAGRMVLKFYQASVSRSRPLRTEINPRGSWVGANFKHQPGPA